MIASASHSKHPRWSAPRPMSASLLVALAVALLASCAAGGDAIKDGADVAAPTPEQGDGGDASNNSASASPSDAWDCQGNLVPPVGWEQETVFEDAATPNAVKVASDAANDKLLRRLCAGASSCDELEVNIKTWKTGQGGGQACAMAVIERRVLESWRRGNTSLASLDAELTRASKELLGDRKKARVAIDKIVDGGAAGGERAEWLEQRMTRALTSAGAVVREIPRNWNGQGLPPGVDVVINANAVSRAERQRQVVEVNWQARLRDGGGFALKVASPVLFAADAAPAAEPRVKVDPLPPSSPDLSVRLETRHGGSLCMGERTQLWLHSAKDMHVRVFDLYGKDGALLLFPNEDHPSDKVRAGDVIALGGKLGFEAVPVPDSDLERFLVIAHPSPDGLGAFKSYAGYCRVEPKLAGRLHQGQGLPPGVTAASDSFRILQRDDCPPEPPLSQRQGQAQALSSLPVCQ